MGTELELSCGAEMGLSAHPAWLVRQADLGKIAHKDEQGVHFERLSDKPNINEFLQDAPLGEVWYSGILGGVPSNP